MKKQIEVVLIVLFLTLFSLGTIYPVLNILGVSLRTDNAFQTRSLSLIQIGENYTDINNKSGDVFIAFWNFFSVLFSIWSSSIFCVVSLISDSGIYIVYLRDSF